MAAKCDWKTKMRKYLGKPLQKHYDNIMMDLILIYIGLKPSLLFDYSFIDPMKIVHLLEDLHGSGMTSFILDVVVMGQDFFITNINTQLKALKESLDFKSFSLIDVSGNLEQPRAVSEEVESNVCRQFDDLLIQLDQKSHLPGLPQGHFYNIDLQQEWNLSTMFGFFLCYPVIYWFDSKCLSNCLSHVPLVLHRTYLKLPFNLHHELSKTFKELANLLEVENPSDSKILYSFSFPQQLNSVVEMHVENWTKYVKRKSLSISAVSVNDQVIFDRTHRVENEVIL